MTTRFRPQPSRREFLGKGALLATAAVLPAGAFGHSLPAAASPGEEEEVAPAEDLMREHGVLNRLLLVYEEGVRRLEAKERFDAAVLGDAAGIVRHFIEDYHEKLEEDYLFPRFEKAGRLVELVGVLRQQHHAGRDVTARIERLATATGIKHQADAQRLVEALRLFVRMYRPHEAREDTVLFPALHEIVSPHEYAALGEEFEDKEHDLFGPSGFEGIVEKVAALEKRLGIYDLAQFTPPAQ
jgi:hemerythrin-like domain-containing protein